MCEHVPPHFNVPRAPAGSIVVLIHSVAIKQNTGEGPYWRNCRTCAGLVRASLIATISSLLKRLGTSPVLRMPLTSSKKASLISCVSSNRKTVALAGVLQNSVEACVHCFCLQLVNAWISRVAIHITKYSLLVLCVRPFGFRLTRKRLNASSACSPPVFGSRHCQKLPQVFTPFYHAVGLRDLDLEQLVISDGYCEDGEGLAPGPSDTDQERIAHWLTDNSTYTSHMLDGILEQHQ